MVPQRLQLSGVYPPLAVAGWFHLPELWTGGRGVVNVWGRFRCRSCERETSLTAGTIFANTRKPLRMWFLAMWFVTSQKNGVSALGLQRVLGLGSYETAWTWLHKLRRAMVRPSRDSLTGVVEVDEIYVGGPEEGMRGRQTEIKAIVAVAAEKSGRGIGRIRLRRVMDVSADSLLPFVKEAVTPGSLVHTDGWSSYSSLAKAGYKHQVNVINNGTELAHEGFTACPYGRFAPQAMADRYSPGWRSAPAPRLLP